MYAHVDGDTITLGRPPRRLATDRGTILGLDGADVATLAEHGWYPVTEQRAALAEGQHHGPPTLTYARGRVTATYPAVDTPPEPLDPTAALATLLAVKGVLTVDEAAEAVGRTRTDLIREAEAWEAAMRVDDR